MDVDNQVNLKKKKKNKNKKQISKNKNDVAKLLETIEHFENLVKKEKKRKSLQDEDTELSQDAVTVNVSVSEKKITNGFNLEDTVNEKSKNKKKKKHKHVGSESESQASILQQGESELDGEIVMKKKKKKSKESKQNESTVEEKGDEVYSKKKRKRKSSEQNENPTIILQQEESELDAEVVLKKKKKKKKSKESKQNEESTVEEKGDEVYSKKKKVKKGKSSEQTESESPTSILQQDSKLDVEVAVKKRKKNSKVNMQTESSVEEADDVVLMKKKEKRKSREQTICENGDALETFEAVNPVKSEKKEKKKSKKLKKGKKDGDDNDSESLPLSSVNDMENRNRKHKDASENSNVLTAGQWAGNMFESSERQSKFIRLLGGAKSGDNKKKTLFSSNKTSSKKGLFGSLVSKTAVGNNEGFSNKAMNLQSAATLDNNLEVEFNKAMNRRVGGLGSSGFGFVKDPAEGKKFHIDSNATKSIKFSDDD